MTVDDVVESHRKMAVQLKRSTPGHADCAGAPGFDPELGVVCYCGEMLGFPPGWSGAFQNLPASLTTMAANESPPVAPMPPGSPVVAENGVASRVHPQDPILSEVDVIDPTQPYDSKLVEEHMLDVLARLERGAHFQRVCVEGVYDKAVKLHLARARAMVAAADKGGSVALQAARADLAVEHEYVEHMIAKMKLDAVKATMHDLRSKLSGYQSINASIRSAFGAAGRQ